MLNIKNLCLQQNDLPNRFRLVNDMKYVQTDLAKLSRDSQKIIKVVWLVCQTQDVVTFYSPQTYYNCRQYFVR